MAPSMKKLLTGAALFALAACSTTDIDPARQLYEGGDFQGAADKIAELHPQDEEGRQIKNRGEDNIWLLLEKGKMLMDAGRWEESNIAFLEADRIFAALDSEATVSLGGIRSGAAALAIDDRQADYVGNAYDRVLLPAYMAINDLMLGDFGKAAASGTSLADALEAARKARGEEAKKIAEMDEEASKNNTSWTTAAARGLWEEKYAKRTDREKEGAPANLASHLNDIQAPLGGMAKLAKRDYSVDFVSKVQSLAWAANRDPKASMRLRPGTAYVIFETGNVPKLEDRSVQFVYTYQAKAKDKNGNERIVNVPSYVKLPFVGMGQATGKSAALNVATSAGSTATSPMMGALEGVVAKEFQDALVGLNARIMLRALIQEAAQLLANEAGGIFGVVGGALLKSQLKPDLRGWQALGAQHQFAEVAVPKDGKVTLSLAGSEAAATELQVPTGVPALVYVRSTNAGGLIAHACPLTSISQ